MTAANNSNQIAIANKNSMFMIPWIAKDSSSLLIFYSISWSDNLSKASLISKAWALNAHTLTFPIGACDKDLIVKPFTLSVKTFQHLVEWENTV